MSRGRKILVLVIFTSIILVIALWLRSYFRLDVFSYVTADGETRAIVSYRGGVHVIAARTNGRPRAVQFDSYRVPRGATYAALHRAGWLRWTFLGFARIKTTSQIAMTLNGRSITVAVPYGGETLPYGPGDVMPLVPWLGGSPYDATIVPWWFVALVLCAYPLDLARRWVQGEVRRRRGCCHRCGYDLRGSSGGMCPECGAALGSACETPPRDGFVSSPAHGSKPIDSAFLR